MHGIAICGEESRDGAVMRLHDIAHQELINRSDLPDVYASMTGVILRQLTSKQRLNLPCKFRACARPRQLLSQFSAGRVCVIKVNCEV